MGGPRNREIQSRPRPTCGAGEDPLSTFCKLIQVGNERLKRSPTTPIRGRQYLPRQSGSGFLGTEEFDEHLLGRPSIARKRVVAGPGWIGGSHCFLTD